MMEAGQPGLVSVVVASYNHAEYLTQRMDSLIGQTYPQIEIIVIDDCSTDHSMQVLQRYESDPRVRLIAREQNGGWVAVSNQGIALSRGEFVIFANCDDACEPGLIGSLVAAIQTNDRIGIAFCRSWFVDAHNNRLGDDLQIQQPTFRARCACDTIISGVDMAKYLLHSCVIPNLSAALFRRSSFLAVGDLSPEFRACSDWDLFFRIATRFDFAYVATPLNHFRQHATTIRSSMKERATYEEYFRVLLGNLRSLALTGSERASARMRVMSLWAVHLVGASAGGVVNFPYHLRRVVALDPAALVFLLPAVVLRILYVAGKLFRGRNTVS